MQNINTRTKKYDLVTSLLDTGYTCKYAIASQEVTSVSVSCLSIHAPWKTNNYKEGFFYSYLTDLSMVRL